MALIAQDGVLNGLHVSGVAAVALNWPGISRQFSVELEFSLPDEGCPFYPFRKCLVPTPLLVNLASRLFSAANDPQLPLLSLRVIWPSLSPEGS